MMKILVLMAATYMGGQSVAVAPGVYGVEACEAAGKIWVDSSRNNNRGYICLPAPYSLR